MVGVGACPICGVQNLRKLRSFVIRDGDALPSGPLADYYALRRRVLFEVWEAPREGFQLRVLVCRACGFVCYSPRPSESDLENKYRFLQVHEVNIGGTTSPETDDVRARQMFDRIRPHAGEAKRVLDCGGGTGKLMKPWLESSHEVFLVDYSETPIAGVTRLGNTLQDLEPGAQFDLAISAHVLEHLVNPVQHLRDISKVLVPGGLIYAEVPFELEPYMDRVGDDPVTHLNYFSPASFLRMAEEAGIRVVEYWMGTSTYSGWSIRFLAFVGKPDIHHLPKTEGGYQATRHHLTPSLRQRVKRLLGR